MTMETKDLQAAYDSFLSVASAGDLGPPRSGEWTAEQQIAHVIATDCGVAAVALAIASGQRPTYDNRYALDEWNLARIIEQHPNRAALLDTARRRGEVLCAIADQLSDSDADTGLRRLIISGTQLVADDSITLGELVEGLARVHLPRHTQQLASLRHP
ncbi:DinB family protein [Nesterenkonia ebinurensis]|uniref:DinB family protein n=1 Tax=Nesterenkonia ebinurensis TaxID=2608252 RepID=UPI00123E22B6|nr:DinB family protein [Nesterenkonia ebinurensis]